MAKDWIPSWFRGSDDTTDEEKEKNAKEAFDKAVGEAVNKSIAPIDAKLKGLESLTAFADDYKKDKEDREKRDKDARDAAARKTAADAAPKKEDLAALMLEDPEAAVKAITKSQDELLLRVSAGQVKSEVFNDRADEFPYYSGEVKAEIDKILGEQSLKFQNDPVAVANTYYTVVGKRNKEIAEGKIKSRFASSSSSANTNGSGKTQPGDDFKIEVSEEMKRAARLSGIPIEDYVKIVEKAAKAGEVDYV